MIYNNYMARPLRIEFPGAVYHILSRGDRKERIFKDDKDRKTFLEILASVVKRYNFLCHAYCLMDNHYHLLIETPDGNLSQGIKYLNGVYTQKFNRVHNTVGHLFQGRFKSILIEKESYLLELCRYIVLNPVRAGIVNNPWQWKWSSYKATAGMAKKPEFLTVEWILSQFSQEQKEAQMIYKEFVLSGIEKESPWKDLKGRVILGKDSFIQKIEIYLKKKKKIKEIPRIERFATRPNLSEILSKTKDRKQRNEKIYTAHIKYGYTLKEIADYLDIHYSTVSKIIKNEVKKRG